ncbi:MAG TPA: hypothetical protein VHP34_00480 [Alphaproteobacteria bacterium]|nr:hypothetical protein [Alphaproteobacteria bacterium]
MSKFLIAALAFMLLAVQPAAVKAAPPVDDAGAAEIKKIVEKAVSFHQLIAEKTGEGFMMGGDVSVKPMGSYYEVRLPDTKAKALGIGDLNIGTLVMNVSYGKRDNEYLVSMALPSPMVFTGADGMKSDIRIGKQRFAGAWETELMTFTRIDSEYGDMVMTTTGDSPFALTMEKMTFLLNLSRNDDGTWTGPNDITFNNTKLIVPQTVASGEMSITIGSLAANSKYEEINLKRALELQQKVQEAVSAVENPYDADISEITSDILNSQETFFNGMFSKGELKNLEVVVNPPPRASLTEDEAKAASRKTFKIDSMSSAVNIEGVKTNRGNFSFIVGARGINLDLGKKSEVMQYVPSDLNFEVYLDSLPMTDLKKTFAGVLQSLFETVSDAEQVAADGKRPPPKQFQKSQVMAAAMAVPQMLSSAGSRLLIKNTYVNAPVMQSKLDGAFSANEAARYIAIGDMTLVLTGLDELILKLQSSTDRMAKQALGSLSILQMMGEQGTGTGGKSARTYKLEVTGEGKITLNGNDVGGMMGMMR